MLPVTRLSANTYINGLCIGVIIYLPQYLLFIKVGKLYLMLF